MGLSIIRPRLSIDTGNFFDEVWLWLCFLRPPTTPGALQTGGSVAVDEMAIFTYPAG